LRHSFKSPEKEIKNVTEYDYIAAEERDKTGALWIE